MCRAGGTVDRLRDADVMLLTVALLGDLDTSDAAFIEELSTGQNPEVDCGTPREDAVGAYVETDLDGLLSGLDALANRAAGGTRRDDPDAPPVPVCDGEACPEGQREFGISADFSSFHLFVKTAPGIEVAIASPRADEPVSLPDSGSGQVRVAGIPLRYRWLAEGAVTVDAQRPDAQDGWVGTWTVTFIDRSGQRPDAVGQAQIFVYGAARLQLADDSQAIAGETTPVRLLVVDQSGQPLGSQAARERVELDVSVTDPARDTTESVEVSHVDDDGAAVVEVSPPANTSASQLVLDTRTQLITQQGLRLEPVEQSLALPVVLPPAFPSVRPAQLDLPSVRGTATTTGTLEVVGPESGSGCVWFESPEVTDAPEAADGLAAELEGAPTEAAECLALESGEAQMVELAVQNQNVVSGGVGGVVVAHLRNAAGQARSVEVPFGYQLAAPVDEAVRLGVFAALLVLGLLVPLAVQLLLNRWNAQLASTDDVRVADVPVTVAPQAPPGDPQAVRRGRGGDEPFAFRPDDFVGAEPARTRRRATVAGFEIAARTPVRNLFGQPVAEAAAQRSATGPEGHRFAAGRAVARLSPGLAGSWLFELDQEPAEPTGEVTGRLVVLVGYEQLVRYEDPSDDLCQRILKEVPPLVRQLHEDLKQRAAQGRSPSDDDDGATGDAVASAAPGEDGTDVSPVDELPPGYER
jgi:hypothetical protein